MFSKIVAWFEERLPIQPVLNWSLDEEIPGGPRYAYVFGSALLFIFAVLVVTGIWQLFYYVPSTDHAYQSVMYIRQHVPFGWLIHGLHYWASNAFILLLVVHMVRTFIWGAYKNPRQLTWVFGVFLLLTVMAMSFTGALLPWDELGFWAASVGTSIGGTVPIVGRFSEQMIRGGPVVGQVALSRFFVVHAAILPALLVMLIALHLVSFRQYGSVGPWDEAKRKTSGPFWPDQVLRDMLIISALFVVLVGLCTYWRAPISGPADSLDDTITPKPEGQFLFLYQFLKLFRGPWEPVGTVGVPLALVLIVLFLPFYDRNPQRNPLRRRIMMFCAAGLIGWIATFTVLGYLANPSAKTGPLKVAENLSPSASKGLALFQSEGCITCHMVTGKGGAIGPNLSSEGTAGRSRQWLSVQIRDPKKNDANTAMPAFNSLSDQQVKELVDFLSGLGVKGGTGQSATKAKDPPPPSGPSDPPGDPPAGKPAAPTPAHKASEGPALLKSVGCLFCHKVNGQGGSIGPDLSKEGTKGRSKEWLATQIGNPKANSPTSVMPAFTSLSKDKVDAIVSYLSSLRSAAAKPQKTPKLWPSPAGPITSDKGPPGEAAYLVGNPDHGRLLYGKLCQRCHGPDAKGGVPNPGSTAGTIPPLNPMRQKLTSPDALTFALKIDPYIQHGSTPAGPNPNQDMPAFGDALTMTQPMISEVEAYVLSLNGVDRGAIDDPGVRPHQFFWITAISVTVIWVGIFVLWIVPRRLPEPRGPEGKTHVDEEKT